jgi:hypothetical protein
MKTQCIQNEFEIQSIHGKRVFVKPDGETVSSDGGLILLKRIEERQGIISRFCECFLDRRNPDLITYKLNTLLRQRVFGICQGYEDLNDHEEWRNDPLLAIACDRVPEIDSLAGKSTLNRLELGPNLHEPKGRYKNISYDAEKVQRLFTELFLDSYKTEPDEITLDVDATDDPLYGHQQGRFFLGYYDEYCYLPLYIFAGEHLLWAELRTANDDPAVAVVPALKVIIPMIRERWKDTRIIVRGDGGFCRNDIMEQCESEKNVFYVLGLPKNKRLIRAIGGSIHEAERLYKNSYVRQRIFRDIRYKTKKSWTRTRRVIGKAEYAAAGSNPRFIVTNFDDTKTFAAQWLYESRYCARGNMENRIKEQKLFMFSNRTSTSLLRANQLRLWLSSVAYVFMVALRHTGLANTDWNRSQVPTIRLKLLKVAAQVHVSVRRIVIHIPRSFPYWQEWMMMNKRFCIT